MNLNKPTLELLAHVKASKHREKIIKYLKNELKTPTEISIELNISLNHTSNLLSFLRKKNLIYCTTPNLTRNRKYKLTKKGNEILKYLK